MGRQRGGGHREPMLHADAQRVLAEDYPPRVKHTILMALRGGRPGNRSASPVARPRGTANSGSLRTPARRSASTAKPVVYWLCDAHYGALADAEIVTLLTSRSTAARANA